MKFRIISEVEIDVQQIFLDNIENYDCNDSISDEGYVIEAIYDVIKDAQIKQIVDNFECKSTDYYKDVKHHKMVDLIIGDEIMKNLKIEII